MPRSNEDLRELSGHVFWHIRQFCRLGHHLKGRRAAGGVAEHPLDAAALEACLIHARALSEFIWRSRLDKPKPRAMDGLAEDYFDDGWRPVHKPARLQDEMQRVGRGLAHVSYRRLDPEEAWGWDLDWLGSVLYTGLIGFAQRVSPERVADGFSDALRREFVDRFRVDPILAGIGVQALGHSVGTPMLAWWLPGATQ